MARDTPFIPINDPIGRPAATKPGERQRGAPVFATETWIQYLADLQQRVGASPQRSGTVSLTGQGASIGSTAIPIGSINAGVYEVSWYARVTRAATSTSSLTVSFGWVDHTVSISFPGTASTGNTTGTYQSGLITFYSDSAGPITYSTTYASSGATSMQYQLYIVAVAKNA